MSPSSRLFVAAAFTVVVAFAGAGYLFRSNLDFYLKTGQLSPVSIVEALQSPIAVAEFDGARLRTVDGKEISLQGTPDVTPPPSVLADVKAHGVEIAPDGTIYALVRVYRWCGNDPVRRHLARVDLASLMICVGNGTHASPSKYGIEPGLMTMAKIPHGDILSIVGPEPLGPPILQPPPDPTRRE